MLNFEKDETAGADALVETYTKFLPNAVIDVGPNSSKFQWQGGVSSVGGLSVLRAQCNRAWQVLSASRAMNLCVAFPVKGGMRGTMQGREHTANVDQAFLTCTADISAMHMLGDDGHTRFTLQWGTEAAQRVLYSVVEHATLDLLALKPIIDLDTPEGSMLYGVAQALAIATSDSKRVSPLAIELLSESALRLIFERIPHSYSSKVAHGVEGIAPRHVKHAVDYMRAHLKEPLRIETIASACQVSTRALEEGFKSFKHTTPSAYLRRLRLEAVREELRMGNPAHTVSDVALRWGFASLGRFSQQYRSAFGENPSQTLRKS
jgi:AraC-like DNA-binding protein